MEAANSVNELIEELIPTAKKVTKTVKKRHQSKMKGKDVEAEVMLALVQVVNKYYHSPPDDWDSFVSRAIIWHLMDFMEYEGMREHEELPNDLLDKPSGDDTLQEILDVCFNDVECEIICLRAEGHTIEYVSNKVGLSERTSGRILHKIEQRYKGTLG